MRKAVLFFALLWSFAAVAQQVTLDFDNLQVPDTGFCNGSNLPGWFADSTQNLSVKLYNYYDENYDYWYGFAYSTWTNDSTMQIDGSIDQWSTYAGYLLDSTFVLGYVALDWNNNYQHIPSGLKFDTTVRPLSIYVSNTTYAALAIINGTAFSEPFDQGDYFYLVITGYLNGQPTDTVLHFLADYRQGKTFVQKDWAYVDLTKLGVVDSMSFDLITSDVGQYGDNTPLYFAMDQLSVQLAQAPATSTIMVSAPRIKVYPNPAQDYVWLSKPVELVQVYGLSGNLLLQAENTSYLQVNGLPAGVYVLKIRDNSQWSYAKFIVRR